MAVPYRKCLNVLFITTNNKSGCAETTLLLLREDFVVLRRSLYFQGLVFPRYLFSVSETSLTMNY